jgi:predicted  nucleic acid-binding Zn-ribbon protein
MYYKTVEDTRYLAEMEAELKDKETTLEKELDKGIKKQKFEIETIKSPAEGIYEINIEALMKKRPLIILEKGRAYIIHLPSVFERFEKK